MMLSLKENLKEDRFKKFQSQKLVESAREQTTKRDMKKMSKKKERFSERKNFSIPQYIARKPKILL